MSKYIGSASDELESVALVGRKGGEAEGEAPTGADDNSDNGGNQGGESSQENLQEQSRSYKVLDREFSSPEELAAEAERANKEILRMKQEQAEARKAAEAKSTQSQSDQSDPTNEKERIRRQLREEYGVVDEQSLKDFFDKEFEFRTSVQKVKDSLANFVTKNDGSNGLPKAEFQELLEVMSRHNFTDPQEAYDKLYAKELKEAYAKELLDKRPKGRMFSERASSSRQADNTQKIRHNDHEARAARRQAIIERHQNGA